MLLKAGTSSQRLASVIGYRWVKQQRCEYADALVNYGFYVIGSPSGVDVKDYCIIRCEFCTGNVFLLYLLLLYL